MTTFGFLWKHIRKVKNVFFTLYIFTFIGLFLARLMVYVGAELVEVISKSDPKNMEFGEVFWLLGALTATTLLSSFCLFMSHIFYSKFDPKFLSNASKEIFRQVMDHSISFFSDEMSGLIMTKISKIDKRIKNILDYFMGFFRTITTFIVTIAIVSFISIKLAIFYFIMCSFFAYITFKARKSIRLEWSDAFKYEGIANGVMGDAINNASVVKSFSNKRFENLYFYQHLKVFLRKLYSLSVKNSWVIYKSNILYDMLSLSFYFALFYTWYEDGMNVANVVFIISSISILSSNVKEFSYIFSGLFRDWGELKEALDFIYQEHSVKDLPSAKKLKVKKADISFDSIDYAYKDKKQLFNKFSLKVSNGEKLGLVGKSGSGKSTLIKLLVRYYDLNKGKITIDGKDISKVTQDTLRKNVAVIPQDTTLFNRSIMENIRYGNTKATNEEVIAASKQAYCHEFISQLPNGYESKVGEKGVMLSGGERQRIAIARAILQDAPILILDEATSALDSESERYIQKALKKLMKNKTVIAIAHRLSTLKEMDRIVVMNEGKIIEEGTQKELLNKKGVFYNFYKIQSESFVEEN